MKTNFHKLMIVAFMFARNTCLYSSDFYEYNRTSAQVTSMFRYGDVETSLFSGRMHVSIPIYTIEDPDFKMNIALNYNAEGFKPRKHSGYVGYNWFLEAGGCVTREVMNYPDEILRSFTNLPSKAEGMLRYTANNVLNKEEVFNLNSNLFTDCSAFGYNLYPNCSVDVDYMPDIFHFNFLGYNGTFLIDNAGNVKIVNGDYVKVDLSGIADNVPLLSWGTIPYPQHNSTIKIQTKNGYTFIFGGDISKLEYTVNAANGHEFVSNTPLPQGSSTPAKVWPATVNTWYLSQIIAPNKRTITFYYKQDTTSLYPGGNSNLWEFNEYYDRFAQYYKDLQYNNPAYSNNIYYAYSMTKTCILDSISVSGTHPLKIIFKNSLESRKMYNHSAHYTICKKNYQLDSTHVLTTNDTIKTASLNYLFKSSNESGTSNYNWRFLNTVNILGEGTYLLDYYHSAPYPDLYTPGNNYHFVEADEYGYWLANHQQALLKEITYPTGGRQTYSYSRLDYSKTRKYTLYGTADIEMSTSSEGGTAYGARISSIQTHIGNNLVETKSYTYSNGIFHNNLYIYGIPNTPILGLPIRDRGNYSLLDTHIGYETVTEHISNPAGTYKTTYKFDMGQDYYNSTQDNDINGYYVDDNSCYGVLAGPLFYSSKLSQWGKLMSIDYYDSNNNILKTTQYSYNNTTPPTGSLIPQPEYEPGCTDTIVMFSHFNGAYVAKKLFIYPDIITQEVENEFDANGQSIMHVKSFVYDNKLRLVREFMTDSKGIQHFTKYTYPDNVGVEPSIFEHQAIPLLVEAHRINTPVESVSGYIQNDMEHITSGSINLYATGMYIDSLPNGAAHLPPFDTTAIGPTPFMLRYYPYLHKTFSLTLSSPITDYQAMGADGTTVTYDPRYILNTEYEFDFMGRPRYIKPLGKIKTDYTWDGIYLSSKKTGNQTYRYTYIPFVGVSSITDPRGITTYYTYDTAGRLIEEYQMVNGNKQIINTYKYHVKTE